MNASTEQQFQPITTSERINSLDVIRGIALLGILLMNVVGLYIAPFGSGILNMDQRNGFGEVYRI